MRIICVPAQLKISRHVLSYTAAALNNVNPKTPSSWKVLLFARRWLHCAGAGRAAFRHSVFRYSPGGNKNISGLRAKLEEKKKVPSQSLPFCQILHRTITAARSTFLFSPKSPVLARHNQSRRRCYFSLKWVINRTSTEPVAVVEGRLSRVTRCQKHKVLFLCAAQVSTDFFRGGVYSRIWNCYCARSAIKQSGIPVMNSHLPPRGNNSWLESELPLLQH